MWTIRFQQKVKLPSDNDWTVIISSFFNDCPSCISSATVCYQKKLINKYNKVKNISKQYPQWEKRAGYDMQMLY